MAIIYPDIDSIGWGDDVNDNFRELSQNDTDIKEIIGTENMGTTAPTLKGAIAEHEEQINNNTTQLNALANEKGYAKVKIFKETTDLNTLTESGIYGSTQFTNSPDGNFTWKIVEVFNMTVSDTYAIQRCMGIANGGSKTYKRQCNAGTWSEWIEQATTEKPTTIKVTPLNGLVTLGGSPGIYYKTQDNIVNINCFLQKTGGITGETTLFNLPAGYRPKEYLRCLGVFISAETPAPTFCNIMIEPSGNVIAKTALTFSNIYVNVSFLAEN